MSDMKAVRIHFYGSTDVLAYEDAPRPVPGEGEILIRVHATSINPFDVALRSGYLVGHFDCNGPKNLDKKTDHLRGYPKPIAKQASLPQIQWESDIPTMSGCASCCTHPR